MRNIFFVAAAILTITTTAAPVTYAATPTPPGTKDVIACQRALLHDGAKFLKGKLQALDECVNGILECVETQPGDPDCIAGALPLCKGKLEDLHDAEDRFTKDVLQTSPKGGKKCAAFESDLTPLLDDHGLGFAHVADTCLADFGADVHDPSSLVECVLREIGRAAERVFAVQQARARELLTFAAVEPRPLCNLPKPPDDSCLLQPIPEVNECVVSGTEKDASNVVKCAQKLAKAGSAFAGTMLAASEKCVKTAIACEEAKPEKQLDCRAHAATTCTNAFAKLNGARTKLEGTLAARPCASVTLALLETPEGLNLEALREVCPDLPSNPTAADYGACIRTQHECRLCDALKVAVPRIAGDVAAGVTYPIGFCLDPHAPCPTPTRADAVQPASQVRIAVAEAESSIAKFIKSIVSIPRNDLPAQPVQGGFRDTHGVGGGTVNGLQSTTPRFVPRKENITIGYEPAAGNTNPTLLIVARDADGNAFDLLTLPLDPAKSTDELGVEFKDGFNECVRLEFAVADGDDGDVGPYVPLEQVPDPRTPSPTRTSNAKGTPTPKPTRTVTPIGTPTTIPTPAVTATPTSATAAGTVTPSRTATPKPTATATSTAPTQTPTPAPTGFLACDTPMTGTIVSPVETDRVNIDLADGDVVAINVAKATGDANFAPVWRLLNGTGQHACEDTFHGENFHGGYRNCGPLPASGNPYRIEIADANFDSTGSYVVYAQHETAVGACENSALACDVPQTGSIADPIETNLLQFDVVDKDVVAIEILNAPGSAANFSTVWRLLDRTGAHACEDTFHGENFHGGYRNCGPLSASGNPYRIEIADSGFDATGAYTAYVQHESAAGACETAALSCDAPQTGSITNAVETNLLQFDVVDQEVVAIEILDQPGGDPNFSTVWRLLDQSGAHACEDTFHGENFHGGYRNCGPLAASGSPYRIEIADSGFNATGAYTAYVQHEAVIGACENILLPCDAPQTGEISDPIETDLWQFATDVADQDVVAIDVVKDSGAPASFTPVWRLLDRTGAHACEDTFHGENFHGGYRNCGPLPATGNPYRVEVVDSGFDAAGSYAIYAQHESAAGACEATPIDAGTPLTGTIDNALETDLLVVDFSVAQGETISVNVAKHDASAPNFKPVWRLLAASGAHACEDTFHGENFHAGFRDCTSLSAAGNPYRIEIADDNFGDVGSYDAIVQH